MPRHFCADARTDKAVDITNFKGGFFVAWKDVGATGNIHVAYLGRHYDTSSVHHVDTITGASSACAPVLRVLGSRIYLFWIGLDGVLNYVINTSDTAFNTTAVHRLDFTGSAKINAGITAAAFDDVGIIAAHGAGRSQLVYALISPGLDGLFPETDLLTVPDASSDVYPFVAALNNGSARFCWKGGKGQTLYYRDLQLRTRQWSPPVLIGHARSKTSPALYTIGDGTPVFYIWPGAEKDKRMYYISSGAADVLPEQTLLPAYFSTMVPVSVCRLNNSTCILAFTGEDKKLYLSYFSNYDPVSWMRDLLLPGKGNYSLKDIVIPGSHDAGMSVLTAAGGTQSGTINECNVLTQQVNIDGQLKAGVRMFDLRIGIWENELYTKHCSSDCMADAIGGGYGEKLSTILDAIRRFMQAGNKEIVLLTFSHFCEQEISAGRLADSVLHGLGMGLVFRSGGKDIYSIPLNQLAGKVIVTFEHYRRSDGSVDSCTIDERSNGFINFRRAYAATNEMNKLLSRQESFFRSLSTGTARNDLVRLDWQLTQSSDEAAMTCNDFQQEKMSPLVNGAMLLTNVIRKHQSIIDLSVSGNKYLPVKLNEWIEKGIVTQKNKPNILYVDVAGAWITDYCIQLNSTALYTK